MTLAHASVASRLQGSYSRHVLTLQPLLRRLQYATVRYKSGRVNTPLLCTGPTAPTIPRQYHGRCFSTRPLANASTPAPLHKAPKRNQHPLASQGPHSSPTAPFRASAMHLILPTVAIQTGILLHGGRVAYLEASLDKMNGFQHLNRNRNATLVSPIPLAKTELVESLQSPSMVRRIYQYLEDLLEEYVVHPVKTVWRFGLLTLIFLPLVITLPVAYMGKRNKDFNNERSGTIWWYSLLVRHMEMAGPTFIKLSQWAASRTDIFPKQLCTMLSKLHNQVKPHSFAHTRRTIEEAFGGRKLEDIFDEFVETPLGIGAIAQVYRGRLKPGIALHFEPDEDDQSKGSKNEHQLHLKSKDNEPKPRQLKTEVAIKVLHPKVARTVGRDLAIMKFFAKLINWIPGMRWISLPDQVAMFGSMMEEQLDLRIEAQNLVTFQQNFRDRYTVRFPTPLIQFSTKEMLIEEYVDALPLKEYLEKGAGPFDNKIADIGLDGFLRMLIFDNFVHADLHPGNIFVRFYNPSANNFFKQLFNRIRGVEPRTMANTDEATKRLRAVPKGDKQAWLRELESLYREGFRPQVVFIDTGLVSELSDKNRHDFLDLFHALAEFDGYRAGKLMIERCRAPEGVIDGEVFALKVQNLILQVKDMAMSLNKIKIADLLTEVMSMVRTHHVPMEGDFANVVISILILEGIGRQLNPNIDLFKTALPILRQLGRQDGGRGVVESFKELPGGGGWWIKMWFMLEARQWAHETMESTAAVERHLDGAEDQADSASTTHSHGSNDVKADTKDHATVAAPHDLLRSSSICASLTPLKPFRTIQRRLVPKRADKDPLMDEQLYFCRTTPSSPNTHEKSSETLDNSAPGTTSYAIFAPMIPRSDKVSSISSDKTSEEKEEMRKRDSTPVREAGQATDIQIMESVLPYYYPKVRGFRYGYISDPEEALEDMEEHAHKEEPSEMETMSHSAPSSQQQPSRIEGEQKAEKSSDRRTAGSKGKSKGPRKNEADPVLNPPSTIPRAGWITLELYLAGDEGEFTSKMQYAFKELFKKLFKWGVNTTKGFTESRVKHDVVVSKEHYLATYARLKERHAQRWVQSWSERTDPRKFVFEDIAIAAWLVALWEQEEQEKKEEEGEETKTSAEGSVRKDRQEQQDQSLLSSTACPLVRKQTFVDLGCGNGLLTHILNEEGYRGTGIDIASRKIWENYGPDTLLEARTLIPGETTFENVDWIIGNHADELAPWIPVIASRSAPLTKFVVIPCCFFALDGSRYQFPNGSAEGKYKAYRDYICEVIDTCGYELETEILRIPSTKNVALIGRKRKQTKDSPSFTSSSSTADARPAKLPRKEDDEGMSSMVRDRVDALVRESGQFVARISDKEKQNLQRTKLETKLRAKQEETLAPTESLQ
ncbi:hypothetical protein BGW38_002682 [Lunasporangiospora selenospora]|uniref:ABC1 atypical kinase-like domain-containing protein n=1 Tax=Lunasporangiospora selenospora TaxID=979761 RepID=A0A9P6KH56_9FUNG|nr:hypothetical protein BGW38_002682 [Lunasporangiospora selenospora]